MYRSPENNNIMLLKLIFDVTIKLQEFSRKKRIINTAVH